MQPKILLVGKDIPLLASRSLLIEDAGLPACKAATPALMTPLDCEDVAVAVLCHTLSSAEKRQVIEAIRQYSPNSMMVHVLKGYSANELPEHASTTVIDGPVQLISVVRELVYKWERDYPGSGN
jgi:hypothetical protein